MSLALTGPFVALTVLAALGLLFAERRGSQLGKWVLKPLAAVGFVGAALASGALGALYGRAILCALVLSLAGDTLLVPKGTGATFRAGMLAFLLAHVAFIVAFATRATFSPAALLRVGACLTVCGFAAVPLVRRAPPRLRAPVVAYAAALSSMVATAALTGEPRLATAAALFLASDAFVALHRFTKPIFAFKVLAAPLYYGAQIVFATSVG